MEISIRDTGRAALYPVLQRLGYRALDLTFLLFADEKDPSAAALATHRRITEAGLSVFATHLSFPIPSIGDYRTFEDKMLGRLSEEIAVTAALGCRRAVLHPYFDDARESTREGNLTLLSKLLPTAERAGVILCLENIYAGGYGDAYASTAEDLLFYTEALAHPALGVCLDSGHAVARGEDPIEMARRLGGTVRALHLHESIEGRDLHLPPTFLRGIDWRALTAALRDTGYDGSFNMEITPPASLGDEALPAYYETVYRIARAIVGSAKPIVF
jgi:sugar phosphate isomerase/epimerase